MGGGFLFQAIIYLGAAVVCVPVAKKLGMGSVLGYLIAGILIGPFFLGFIGEEGEDIMHFAEFGVVMMLFLVGLELEPEKLWKIRKQILGVGLSQVVGTTLVLFVAGILLDLKWQSALAISLALAMSSTAIVLQSLKEKGSMQTASGQSSFAVLLFQDVSVIPILAILPLLAFQQMSDSVSHSTLVDNLPGWLHTLFLLGAVGMVILIGRYGIVPLLRVIAKTRLRELFTASSLLIVVGIAYLMEIVGLSPALGTFLAGVILATSEFKHELESDLEPFKGLLLGLFFIAVGASINFLLIIENPVLIISLTLGIVFVKALVLFSIGKFSGLSKDQNLIFALGLSQVGEFAFVLLSFIYQLNIIRPEINGILMAVTAISMTSTPILNLLNEKIILPRFGTREAEEEKGADLIEEKNKVIIAGFSHFGSTIGRFLRANGVDATILDNNSDQVDLLRKMGFKVYYGDATRADLLESAGAGEAEVLITAIDSPETNYQLVETVQKHFPHLQLLVRTKNRYDAYEMIDLGVKDIYREHLDTSVRLGVDVLRKLGFRHYSAMRAGQNFIKYDEEALWQLARHRHDVKQYIWNVRQQIEQQEVLLQRDKLQNPSENDHAWDSELMRKKINEARRA